jgi:hypothetical protein
VRASHYATWQVTYYVKKNNIEKAREIADQAAEVYSHPGLTARAVFDEMTTNYDGAFEWYEKIEERYNAPLPLIAFCLRMKSANGETRFEPEVEKRLDKLFPKGRERVSLNDLKGPPQDGVLIREENALLRSAGMKAGDVIVAVYGVRVHHLMQYLYLRDSKPTTPELELIAWQSDAYREFKASPPQHRFGLDFVDYCQEHASSLANGAVKP